MGPSICTATPLNELQQGNFSVQQKAEVVPRFPAKKMPVNGTMQDGGQRVKEN